VIANTAKQRRDNHISPTTAPIKRIIKNLQAEIRSLEVLAKWCAMPTGEL
jgi:hypothetical protein